MGVKRQARQPTLLAGGRLGEQRAVCVEDIAVLPLDLDALMPGEGPWEVEIGFGKGRYLVRRASEDKRTRFLGIELVSRYFRMLARRSRHHGLDNLLAMRGEALYLLSACLPGQFARAIHIYFPDPWPKARHQKRRLFEAESIDLLLAALAPGGSLVFATDFLAYGERVEFLLRQHPCLDVETFDAWPEGPRTNYEAKYVNEGRRILRLEARLSKAGAGQGAACAQNGRLLHPAGLLGIVNARSRPDDQEEEQASKAVESPEEATSKGASGPKA